MKWILLAITTLKQLTRREQWIHGLLWLSGVIIINWPGQRITIGIFHSEHYELLVPSFYGCMLNAMIFYLVMEFLLKNGQPIKGRIFLKTFFIYIGITIIETIIDGLHFHIWIGSLNGSLVREALITNALLNGFFFYVPGLVYGLIKGSLGATNENFRISVQDGHLTVYLIPDELLYLESDGNYVKFHQEEKVILERGTLIQVMERLPTQFIRCHKSYIINQDLIEKQSANEVVIKGRHIPIGRKFKENLFLQ